MISIQIHIPLNPKLGLWLWCHPTHEKKFPVFPAFFEQKVPTYVCWVVEFRYESLANSCLNQTSGGPEFGGCHG